MWLPADSYITVDQYRRLCGYTHGAILTAIKQGRLKAFKIGRDYIVSASAILITNRNGQSVGKYKKYVSRREQIDKELSDQGYNREDLK